jgi:hypothetical protein
MILILSARVEEEGAVLASVDHGRAHGHELLDSVLGLARKHYRLIAVYAVQQLQGQPRGGRGAEYRESQGHQREESQLQSAYLIDIIPATDAAVRLGQLDEQGGHSLADQVLGFAVRGLCGGSTGVARIDSRNQKSKNNE